MGKSLGSSAKAISCDGPNRRPSATRLGGYPCFFFQSVERLITSRPHGRRTADVMTREVITVNDDASLEEIAELLERHRIKRVPVIRGDRLVGIVSRANLLHGLVAGRTSGDPSADDRKLKVAVEKSLSDAGVRAQLLNVVASGGVVYVWGVVVTPEEKAAVRAAVETAPGVKDIRTNVDVLPAYMRPFMRAG